MGKCTSKICVDIGQNNITDTKKETPAEAAGYSTFSNDKTTHARKKRVAVQSND